MGSTGVRIGKGLFLQWFSQARRLEGQKTKPGYADGRARFFCRDFLCAVTMFSVVKSRFPVLCIDAGLRQ